MSERPATWEQTTLGELAEYVTSGSRDWSRYYANEGALFIRTEDINRNTLCTADDIARVSLPEKVEGKRTLVQRGDILITITGANVGKCAEIEQDLPEAYVSQSVGLVRLRDASLASFLQRQLIAADTPAGTELEQRAYGLGRPVLSLQDLRDVPIHLPPFPEQRRIVAKIDSLTGKSRRARDHLDRIPRLVEKYKQAVLAAGFRGDLTREWRTAHAAAGWQRTSLGAVVTIASGQTPKGVEERLSGDGAVPWFKVSSMNEPDNLAGLRTSQFNLSEPDARDLGFRIFEAGSVAFPKRGGAIATNKKRKLLVRGALDLNVMVLTATGVSADFLWWWMQSLDLASISNGSNVPQINNGDISPLPIDVPSQAEQAEIARLLDATFSWIDRLASDATSARKLIDRLDQAVLTKAFRGELVPQDPADEPASTLLARIKAEPGKAPKQKRRGNG